ncbi:SCO3242 family prenyltransferase [Streptomyces sp. NPDC058662]|uniref:SCO3242 family prenyltransferase n=1 Tax=Streptomyces sp. NPDC058662 TaxID=3346583 RepID=UPI00364F4AFD
MPGRRGSSPAVTDPAATARGARGGPAAAPHEAAPTGPAPTGPGASARETFRAWSELLRVSALFSVPGDALAGAAAAGVRPGRGTAWAVGSSLCLYEAGMALNDWADRHEDAVERPHRPLPSGRVSPGAALGAAGALTVTGLSLAARAGRPALTVAAALAATVWAYDLRLKHTAAGPLAMAAARGLDLVLGAVATVSTTRGAPPRPGAPPPRGAPPPPGAAASLRTATALRAAAPAAAALAAHTYAVTAVSRHETQGGSTSAPLGALAVTAVLGVMAAAPRPAAHRLDTRAGPPSASRRVSGSTTERVTLLLATTYLRTAAGPLLHAALNPSPLLTQRAVGGGIRAMIPLQAALAARSGAPVGGLALLGLAPAARRLARRVSPT